MTANFVARGSGLNRKFVDTDSLEYKHMFDKVRASLRN